MPSLPTTKQFIVMFSNIAILALCAAGVANNWSQSAFQLFLSTKLPQVWPCLLIYPAFLLLMPLLPRPKLVAVKTAAAPSVNQARVMAVATALIDYTTVGSLFLFWDRICRLEDGSLCPFTATGTLFLQLALVPIKDEIQCRFLWRKFVSPYKLNSWPFSWKSSCYQLFTTSAFGFLSFLALLLGNHACNDSILSWFVLLRIYFETVASFAVTEILMHLSHRWMHEQAYFLHKKHHTGKSGVMSLHAPDFDLIDLIIEFGAGIPTLIVIKQLLRLDPKIHFLTFNFQIMVSHQLHSGNPYAVYFFNPVLDHFARTALGHNLHHAIQKGHYLGVPWSHFVCTNNRQNDIRLYNKHMNTCFPEHI